MAGDAMKIGMEVLMRNSPEVAQIVERAGGWMNLVQALPALYKIMQTVKAVNAESPDEAMPMQYGMQTFAEVKARQRQFGFTGSDVDGIYGDKTNREYEKRLKMLDATERAKKDK